MRIFFYYCLLSLVGLTNTLANKPTPALSAKAAAHTLHDQACAIEPYVADNPWHIANLYNCATRELFIPYQLWTGANWNGDKDAPCMHPIDNTNILERPTNDYARGEVVIKGPIEWHNPFNDTTIQVWERYRPHRNASKYYACHKRGIGAIHNPKKPNEQYVEGLCQAPAGHGWMIGKRRTCIKVTLEIMHVTLDANMHLSSLKVKYWWRDKLRYAQTYVPNKGIKNIFVYPRN